MDALLALINSFRPEEVLTSVRGFLGSGYIGVIIVALLAYGFVKKLVKLLLVVGMMGCLWFLVASGTLDSLFRTLNLM